MKNSELLVAVVCITISFWVGVIFANAIPVGDLKLWIDFGVAVGTIGAVLVALSQGWRTRVETRSLAYRQAAIEHLRDATEEFLREPDSHGRPQRSRVRWLDFARAIKISRSLASRIELQEQRAIWLEQEHLVREKVYAVLYSDQRQYPTEYFWPKANTHPTQRPLEISESSLVVIYQWADWPADRADPLDNALRFSDEERARLELLPATRGLAEYLNERRPIEPKYKVG